MRSDLKAYALRSVSYTHLDVYKRQGGISLSISNELYRVRDGYGGEESGAAATDEGLEDVYKRQTQKTTPLSNKYFSSTRASLRKYATRIIKGRSLFRCV